MIMSKLEAENDAEHYHNLRRLPSSGRDFGPSCTISPCEGRLNRDDHLPSHRAGGSRMRIRSVSYPVARSMGSVALGALRSEDVGKPIATSVFAIVEATGDRWAANASQVPFVHRRGRLLGRIGIRFELGRANESSCTPNPVWFDRHQSTPIGSRTARWASCTPNPVWFDRH